MDQHDRAIINALQGGFPICNRPYAVAAERLGLDEADLITRIRALLDQGILSRFGPMYHAERMGGSLVLTAMRVPESEFDRVAETINAMPEVAHNYEREHELNMWFVVATGTPEEAGRALSRIEAETGYPVYPMPKLEEYYVGLRFEA